MYTVALWTSFGNHTCGENKGRKHQMNWLEIIKRRESIWPLLFPLIFHINLSKKIYRKKSILQHIICITLHKNPRLYFIHGIKILLNIIEKDWIFMSACVAYNSFLHLLIVSFLLLLCDSQYAMCTTVIPCAVLSFSGFIFSRSKHFNLPKKLVCGDLFLHNFYFFLIPRLT